MDCFAWIADEINANIHLVPKENLWYQEQRDTPMFTINANEGEALFDHAKVRGVSHADLRVE